MVFYKLHIIKVIERGGCLHRNHTINFSFWCHVST